MKPIVIGNIAKDNYPINEFVAELIKKELASKGIVLDSSPKQTIEGLEEILAGISSPMMIAPGGGGYNSLRAFARLKQAIYYLDISEKPGLPLIQSPGLIYDFLGLRKNCISLILKIYNDRKVVKSPRYDQESLEYEQLEEIIEKLSQFDSFFVNSIANFGIASRIGKNKKLKNKPRYVGVTKNFDFKALQESCLVKNATAIIDLEEADILGVKEPEFYPRIYQALDAFNRLGVKNAVATFGKDGVAYTDFTNGIKIASTYSEKEAVIQNFLRQYDIQKNGAGDFFSGALVYNLMHGKKLEEAVLEAQLFVVQKFLKYPDIKKEDFQVYRLK